MQNVRHLLRTRRFLPIFVTQFLGAFNDNLFRTSMVMLVIYGIYRDAEKEATFSAVAGGLFILLLLLRARGQLAIRATRRIIRIVKTPNLIRSSGGRPLFQSTGCAGHFPMESTRLSSGRSNTQYCAAYAGDEVLGATAWSKTALVAISPERAGGRARAARRDGGFMRSGGGACW